MASAPASARFDIGFDNVLHAPRLEAPALVVRAGRLLVLAAAWALCALPVVTWLAASAALVQTVEQGGGLRDFTRALRLSVRRTPALGAGSAAVSAVLVVNLLFLTGRQGGAAVVLAVGTVALIGIWVLLHLALVPVVVLFPDAGPVRWMQAAFVIAFRQPLRTAGVAVLAGILGGLAAELSPFLLPLCAPLVGHLALRLCLRQVATGPGGTAVIR